ncbi:M20/M25/M40 family metallo-hydrolase [Candidatus Neomarinimicrobiota bacterium]
MINSDPIKRELNILIVGMQLLALLSLTGCASSPDKQPIATADPAITKSDIYNHIAFLASDDLAGRYPGTPGSIKAAKYIANEFRRNGIMPFPQLDGYFQQMQFTSAVEVEPESYLQLNGEALRLDIDYSPLSYSKQGTFSGSVASVGYGLDIQTDTLEWHDYAGVSADSTWMLLIDGVPDTIYHAITPSMAMLKQKVLVAKDKGVAGILVLAGSAAAGVKPIQRAFVREFKDSGVLVVSISDAVGDRILGGTGRVSELRESAGSMGGGASHAVPSIKIDGAVYLNEITHEIANVAGYLEGNDPALQGQYIVVGAHYDHLGYGGSGSGSLAPNDHAIHNGADDNASGVAGLLEIAQKLASANLGRSVIFVAFNAEEEGLLGSKYFVNDLPIDKDSLAMMINLDMIGRLRDDQLTIGGTGTAPIFERVLPEFNRAYRFELTMSPEGPGPGDHAAFYYKDIPVLFAFTGAHEDYHKPTDDVAGIDTAGTVKVANFVYDVTEYFSQRPARPQFKVSGMAANTTSRRSFRVTFGVIPAFGTAADGLALDGVIEDRPAATAGLHKGDTIIEINGNEIHNIQDYMYRLNELKPGDTVQVKARRGDETLDFTLQL